MRRKSKFIPPSIRRFIMFSWLKLTWSEPIFTTFLTIIITLVLLASSASGGIIVVMNVDMRVTARNTVDVEIPYNIGFFSFHQNEAFQEIGIPSAAHMSAEPVYESGNQLDIHTINEGYTYDSIIWAGLATPIGQRSQLANHGLLWGDGRDIPYGYDGDGDPNNTEPFLYIPWQFALQPQNNTLQYGYGWVSISHIDTRMPPMTPTGVDYNVSPSYIVHQIVFATEEISISAGIIPPEWYGGGGGSNGGGNSSFTPVPEPSVVFIIGALVLFFNRKLLNGKFCCA